MSDPATLFDALLNAAISDSINGTPRHQRPGAVAEGIRRRDEGVALIDRHTSDEWKAAADRAIRVLARSGHQFDASDVRQMAGDPPSHPNALPARFQKAAKAGLIVAVGWRTSDRPERHAGALRVWVGK